MLSTTTTNCDMSSTNGGVSKKEVIRFKAKKYDGYTRPESKTFSVDPDLTTFVTLRELLIKAFDIKGDFVISYLVRGHKGSDDRYLPMLSEWDLNTAVYGASDPHVVLKVDLKPFEASGLDEWDIIDEDDVARVAATSSSIFGNALPSVQQIFGGISTNSTTTQAGTNGENDRPKKAARRSWFFGRSVSNNENSSTTQNGNAKKNATSTTTAQPRGPMSDAEFRSYLDAEGRLLHPNAFRIRVFKTGLEPSLRPVVWRHLLSIYPDGMTGEERIAYTKRLAEKYDCLKESWQRRLRQGFIGEELRLVANAVRKDVVRTDRTHPFFAGDEDRNKNLMALFNLLTTYALAHPEVSYCQGMSDLASPLLVVMKDEAQAYICFCALMRRLRKNFSCDGWAMTRKFQHLSELLQYYDPTFYEYLREMHADDLLFAYRWLLLELKREFAFDDALNLMEVMWASLPPQPPERGCDLDLYDVDLTQYDETVGLQHHPTTSMSNWSSSAGSGSTLLSPLQLPQQLASSSDDDAAAAVPVVETMAPGQLDHLEMDGVVNATETPAVITNGNAGVNIGSMPRSTAKPFRKSSATSTHSCPGNMGCTVGVCPALVVRSLMMDHKENTRLHALRHASFPPKSYAIDVGGNHQSSTMNNNGDGGELFSRLATDRWVDEHRDKESGRLIDGPISITIDTSAPMIDRAQSTIETPKSMAQGATNSFDVNMRMVRRNSDVSFFKSYAVRPSTETSVKDKEERRDKNECREDIGGAFTTMSTSPDISPGQVLPALIATEAANDNELDWDRMEKRDLTLTDIQEICLSHIPLEESSPVVPAWTEGASGGGSGSKQSPNGNVRSREPSGGGGGGNGNGNGGNQIHTSTSNSALAAPTTNNSAAGAIPPVLTSSSITNGQSSSQISKSRHASSSAASYIVTNLDSGYSDSNQTALTRSLDFASRASTTASTDPQNVADVAEFISVDRDPRVLLPAPYEFGDGNPFMLFVCLTLLLQHRDHIMKNVMDFNDIAMYFDKLTRKHSAAKVLKRARVLFADYLRTGWFDNSSTITRTESNCHLSPIVQKYLGDNGLHTTTMTSGAKSNYWSLF